jgi:cobalt-zinc-cadmium efflux system outer membrane protein
VRAEVVQAVREEQFRAASVSAYPSGVRESAREGLRSLASALAGGRLGVRDALLSQRALIDLLEGDLTARLELALARVELARAAALPDEEGGQ